MLPMRLLRCLALAFVVGATASAGVQAQAGWLTRILKEAGDTAGDAGKFARLPDGFSVLDDAARHIRGVTAVNKGLALAAHVTPEGHWKFVNKKGDVYTAANPQEMARVQRMLAPDAPDSIKVSYYLSSETVFQRSSLIRDLPDGADLYLVDGRSSYRLVERGVGEGRLLFASIQPNLVVRTGDRRLFDEAVFQLKRPLNRSNIRLLALEPGGPKELSPAPRFDPKSKTAMVDVVDPASLETAFSSIRGQSAVLSGQVRDGLLRADPAAGGTLAIPVARLKEVARANDVNLIVLNASAARQPGGRNWLWQRVEVEGYDDAIKRATFGDFLNVLGASRGEFAVTATDAARGRISLSAVPSGDAAQPLTGKVSTWIDEAIGEVTGNVLMKSVDLDVRDEERQRELDRRLISWLPSSVHMMYLSLFVLGVVSLAVVRDWWRRLWPREDRSEYRGKIGYWAARCVRALAFLFVFLPLAALPALPVTLVKVIWGYIMMPVRFFRWIFGAPAGEGSR